MAAMKLKAGEEIEFLVGQALDIDETCLIIIDIAKIDDSGRWPKLWRVRDYNKGQQEILVPSGVFFVVYGGFKLSIDSYAQGIYKIKCENLE